MRANQEKSDDHSYHIFSVHSTLSENRHVAYPIYTTVHVRGRMHTEDCLTTGPDFQILSPHLASLLLQNDGEHGKASYLYEQKPMDALH